jgi:HPr kinase/phosphorylase
LGGGPKLVERVHGTAIAAGGRACLIRGPSGSGKSDLALRCLSTPVSMLLPDPSFLVGDDQVELVREGLTLVAKAPATIAGKLEVRGQGIVTVPTVAAAPLVLIADLIQVGEAIERLPDPIPRVTLLGLDLPVFRLNAFEASAPVKLLVALRSRFGDGDV